MITGFKSFFEGHKSIDGKEYVIGVNYHQDGEIIFGKCGFHLCKNIEDTFMYFPEMCDNVSVAIVKAWGDIIRRDDDYRGCYDMYVASDMRIIRFLSREEIINRALQLYDFQLKKFVSRFKLTEDEIKLFYGKDYSIDRYIDYHQRGIKDAFDCDKRLDFKL